MPRSEDLRAEKRLLIAAPANPPLLRAARPSGANPGVSGRAPFAGLCESGVEIVRPSLLGRLRGLKPAGTMKEGEEGSEKARSSVGGLLMTADSGIT